MAAYYLLPTLFVQMRKLHRSALWPYRPMAGIQRKPELFSELQILNLGGTLISRQVRSHGWFTCCSSHTALRFKKAWKQGHSCKLRAAVRSPALIFP